MTDEYGNTILIDPQEAVEAAKHAPCPPQAYTANAIAKAFHESELAQDLNEMSYYLFLFQTIFNAGQIVGIREERKRRNHSEKGA